MRKDMGVGSPMVWVVGHGLCHLVEGEEENNVRKTAQNWINAKLRSLDLVWAMKERPP